MRISLWNRKGRRGGGRRFSWEGGGFFRMGVCGLWLAFSMVRGGAQEVTPTDATGAAEKGTGELKKLSLEDLMNVQVKEVTTASKWEEKTTQTPGMTYVIDKNDIKLRGYSQLTAACSLPHR